MPRFRLGPVRVGGGRRASIGFHAGPVGVTFGGRRKRSSGGRSSNSETYVMSEPEVRAKLISGILKGPIGENRVPKLIWLPLALSISFFYLVFVILSAAIVFIGIIDSFVVVLCVSFVVYLCFIRRKIRSFDSAAESSPFELRIWDMVTHGITRTGAEDSIRNRIYSEYGYAYVEEVLALPENGKAKSRFKSLKPNTHGLRFEHLHAISLGGAIGILLSQLTQLPRFNANISAICTTPGQVEFHDKIAEIFIKKEFVQVISAASDCREYANIINLLKIGSGISILSILIIIFFFAYELRFRKINIVRDTISLVRSKAELKKKKTVTISANAAKEAMARRKRKDEKSALLREKFNSTKKDVG